MRRIEGQTNTMTKRTKKNRRTDNTMTKRTKKNRRTDNTMTKRTKKNRRTDNTMTKRKNNIYKTLHRKPKVFEEMKSFFTFRIIQMLFLLYEYRTASIL